jgi:uncharacterized protein (DUF934 family)
MPLIKDGVVTKDEWRYVEDSDTAPDLGPIIVSFDRWREQREQLISRNSPVGIRLTSSQSPVELSDDLDKISLFALEFPAFKDGRAYSYAKRLRDQFGFAGEIRAVGDVLRDQFQFMVRCGFDALEPKKEKDAAAWDEALSEFSFSYQPMAQRAASVLALRNNAMPQAKAS